MSDPENILERRFLGEIALINRRIAELEQERKSVERLLIRLRRSNVSVPDSARRNSANRIMVEQAILKRLEDFKGFPVQTSDLKRVVQNVDLWIKDNTFRSHLYRLRERGLIESAGYGTWRMSTPGKIE